MYPVISLGQRNKCACSFRMWYLSGSLQLILNTVLQLSKSWLNDAEKGEEHLKHIKWQCIGPEIPRDMAYLRS